MPGEREGTERYGQQKRRVCLIWDRAGSKGGVEGPIRLEPRSIPSALHSRCHLMLRH